MSALPDSENRESVVPPGELSPVRFVALGTAVAVIGLSIIWLTMVRLWIGWTTDALKSIGMVIPLVSLVLILRAWKSLEWRAEGTWWGLALLIVTAAVARVQQLLFMMLVVSPRIMTLALPSSLMLFAYGSGAVLLLGGVRLYRAALFPILLLLFADPVPLFFSLLVDLPLQHASAYIARAFAMSLGNPLTPDNLRLMFTPDFGMFIAPGCNGIRGSITMGFIALIAGYIYRFRWYTNVLAVLGAVLLGYVFNLARLCMLVLYYVVALHFPSLQNEGEMADYLIGATLFLFATFLLFAVIHRLRDAGDRNAPEAAILPEQCVFHRGTRYAQLAAMTAIALFGVIGLARAKAAIHPLSTTLAEEEQQFPLRVGKYTRVRTWPESVSAGSVVYVWAEYVPADGGVPIAIGVSPTLGQHDPLLCHYVRGETPQWRGQLTTATAAGPASSFSSFFFNDGVTQSLVASTICNGSICGEYASEHSHFGFLYTRTNAESLLRDDPMHPIPVVLHVESLDLSLPADTARRQLTQDLQTFLASVNLDDLTRLYGR